MAVYIIGHVLPFHNMVTSSLFTKNIFPLQLFFFFKKTSFPESWISTFAANLPCPGDGSIRRSLGKLITPT